MIASYLSDSLPQKQSILFNKINLISKIIFDKEKTIYSWGSLEKEIKYASHYSLFNTTIYAKVIDLQCEFSHWYRRKPPFCEVCKPERNTHVTRGSSMFCACRSHPYDNPSNLWSLQNAVLYATNCFLDKAQTENNWFEMLDAKHRRTSPDVIDEMIHYAVYDCLSVTYLRLGIIEQWPLKQFEQISMEILLTNSIKSIVSHRSRLPSENEFIDAIPLSPCDNHQQQNPHEKMNETIEFHRIVKYASSLNNSTVLNTVHSSKNSHRSPEARARRNRKRNMKHRLRRYQYYITRRLSHHIKSKEIRMRLDKLGFSYTHIKPKGNFVIIGMEKCNLDKKLDRLLPFNIFD